MNSKYFIFFFCLWYASTIISQETIHLLNPSFEDFPRKGGEFAAPINSWYDCGLPAFPNESPPDIHPVKNSPAWGVNTPPYNGKSYLGLVFRYNDTWESVSQKLEVELKPEICYSLTGYLCISPDYKSGTARSRGDLENFANPGILRIWGGKGACEKNILLAESSIIDNTDWKEYSFLIRPAIPVFSITLEAYYAPKDGAVPSPYNGHVLIDNIAPIIEVPCK